MKNKLINNKTNGVSKPIVRLKFLGMLNNLFNADCVLVLPIALPSSPLEDSTSPSVDFNFKLNSSSVAAF